MKNKIDFVVSYVNPRDDKWLNLAEKYNVFNNTTGANKILRYSDDGVIELCIKSIRKYCDFAGDIYLIVFDSDNQVPDCIKNDVKIIKHSEFIPSEYNPCFNSCTIEVFLPFLPHVSELFIYMNDDMVFTKKQYYDSYFKDEKPLSNLKFSKNILHQDKYLLNSYNLIIGKDQQIDSVLTNHGPTPFSKKQMLECFNNYKKELLSTLSPIHRGEFDVSQYVYSVYDKIFYNNDYVNINNLCLYGSVKTYNNLNWDNINQYDSICLNSSASCDVSKYVNIIKRYLNN